MDARHVEQAGRELHDLRFRGIEEVALGAAALVLAIVATEVKPSLALPLFVGGAAVAAIGIGALVHRYLLIEQLVCDPDAYLIPDVRSRALQAASPGHRRALARSIRGVLADPGFALADRVAANRAELEELVAALERDDLSLDPACAVSLERLLEGDELKSPLYDTAVPPVDLRSRLLQILAGFEQRRRAA